MNSNFTNFHQATNYASFSSNSPPQSKKRRRQRTTMPDGDEFDSEKELKLKKNRESAARSRQKKARLFKYYEEQVIELTEKNNQLMRTLALLTSQCETQGTLEEENRQLKQRVYELQLQVAKCECSQSISQTNDIDIDDNNKKKYKRGDTKLSSMQQQQQIESIDNSLTPPSATTSASSPSSFVSPVRSSSSSSAYAPNEVPPELPQLPLPSMAGPPPSSPYEMTAAAEDVNLPSAINDWSNNIPYQSQSISHHDFNNYGQFQPLSPPSNAAMNEIASWLSATPYGDDDRCHNVNDGYIGSDTGNEHEWQPFSS